MPTTALIAYGRSVHATRVNLLFMPFAFEDVESILCVLPVIHTHTHQQLLIA